VEGQLLYYMCIKHYLQDSENSFKARLSTPDLRLYSGFFY